MHSMASKVWMHAAISTTKTGQVFLVVRLFKKGQSLNILPGRGRGPMCRDDERAGENEKLRKSCRSRPCRGRLPTAAWSDIWKHTRILKSHHL